MATLTVDSDRLCLNGGMIVYQYPEGDADTVSWPLTDNDRKLLARALYGEYEMGNLTERTVILPDGTDFHIDDHIE